MTPPVNNQTATTVLTVNTMRGETSFQLEEEPTINIDGKNGVIVIDTINDSYLFSINNIECMRYTDDCNVYYQ